MSALASLRPWEANERAMRLGQRLPRSRLPQLVAAGVGVIAVVAVVR